MPVCRSEHLSMYKQQSILSADLHSIVKSDVINSALHLYLEEQPVGRGRSCEPLFAPTATPPWCIATVIGWAQTNTV